MFTFSAAHANAHHTTLRAARHHHHLDQELPGDHKLRTATRQRLATPSITLLSPLPARHETRHTHYTRSLHAVYKVVQGTSRNRRSSRLIQIKVPSSISWLWPSTIDPDLCLVTAVSNHIRRVPFRISASAPSSRPNPSRSNLKGPQIGSLEYRLSPRSRSSKTHFITAKASRSF
ncbi:hypothetical protein B0T13DRAFT_227078 [Neurospora crassa]|nr:hypothetical protein B0T13DRAFT_227078 [Neurospora crassa]